MESNRSTSFFLYLLFAYCHHCTLGQSGCKKDTTYMTELRTDDLQIFCENGGIINMLASCHCGWSKGNKCYPNRGWLNNQKEDRRWKWGCDHEVRFSANDQDPTILQEILPDSGGETRMCPKGKAVKKIWSDNFDVDKRDRNFFIECDKLLSQTILEKQCRTLPNEQTNFVEILGQTIQLGPETPLDGSWLINVTKGYVLKGMWTKHSGGAEDRKFKFWVCRHCATPYWAGWSHFSPCAACDSGATDFVEIRSRKCIIEEDKKHLSDKCKLCDGKEEEKQSRSCICRQSAPTKQNVHELEDLINSGNITLNDTGIDEAEQEVTDQEEDVVTEALDLNVTGQVLGGGQGFNELKKNDGDGPLIDLSSPRVIFCIIIIGVSAMMIIGTLGYVAYYTFGQGGNTALDAQGKKGESKKKREQEKEDNESDETDS